MSYYSPQQQPGQNNMYGQNNFIDKEAVSAEAAKAFVTQVFGWMFLAMVLSAGIAYAFATSDLIYMLFDHVTGKPSAFFWVALLSPIGIVLLMNFGLEKLSFGVILLLFISYASLMGISLSTIFLAYEPLAIAKAFGITAGAFGVMAVTGYTTKTDLSKFGMIMIFGLVGIVIASLFNMFGSANSQFSLLIDIACIIVFTGLIAWKMQMVRQMGEQVGTTQPKLAVFMALSLYITFINLFLTILRFMRR
ncbi:MAG: Bax inhibitor-1/YccA family protein [Bacteroidia bacterium]